MSTPRVCIAFGSIGSIGSRPVSSLSVKVRCNESAMTIELRTGDRFFGRMYANGHADRCGVQGIGSNRTVLTLPVPAADKVREGNLRCGLSPAFPIGDQNR